MDHPSTLTVGNIAIGKAQAFLFTPKHTMTLTTKICLYISLEINTLNRIIRSHPIEGMMKVNRMLNPDTVSYVPIEFIVMFIKEDSLQDFCVNILECETPDNLSLALTAVKDVIQTLPPVVISSLRAMFLVTEFTGSDVTMPDDRVLITNTVSEILVDPEEYAKRLKVN